MTLITFLHVNKGLTNSYEIVNIKKLYLLDIYCKLFLPNMKNITLIALLTCLCFYGFANDPIYQFPKPQKGTIKILSTSNKRFIVTPEYIFEIKNDKIKKTIHLSFVCNDATILNGYIAIATDSGIIMYSISLDNFKPYLREYWNKKIDYITTDAHNQLWFSSMYEGAFLINHDSIINLKIQAPVTYCIASTPDSNIWVGTNIGLYKILSKTLQSERYAEEGIEGYSIPDNIVEKLYADDDSNVWAQLSETIVFISSEQQSEPPAFDFIGDKENKLLSVVKLNTVKDGYLFATGKGIVFVKNIKALENHQSEEIHSTFEKKGVLLPDYAVKKPKEFKDLLIKTIYLDKHFTWFITEQGVWKIKNKVILTAL